VSRAASLIAVDGATSDGLSEDVKKPNGKTNGKTALARTRAAAFNRFACRVLFRCIVTRYLVAWTTLDRCWVVEMSRCRVLRASLGRFSIVPHAHQLPDEDEYKAMRVACYLICAMSVTILVALLFYTMLR
jgi:hypothetical protein